MGQTTSGKRGLPSSAVAAGFKRIEHVGYNLVVKN